MGGGEPERWAALLHVAEEGPGLIAGAAVAAGVELEPVRLWEGEEPPAVGELAGLVVMGGPMSVNDGADHTWLAAEVELLRRALERELPVLGVCLGAQLLASALGAAVRPAGGEEVGAGSVTLTNAGREDPLLGPAGDSLPVFHWHGETFDLPAGRPSLAASERCENQGFRAGECAWGLQFHVELDRELAAAWRPLLPAGVGIEPGPRAAIERAGRALLGRFFALAATR